MKTLTLLRHAKSGWDDPVVRDFDRPLNAKGRRAAVAVGRHMGSEGFEFDHVVASPAVRVSETIEALAEGYGRKLDARRDGRIYLASAGMLLDIIHGLPPAAATALLVGHNPGLEDLVLMLVPAGADQRGLVEEKYPTATIAELTFEGEWSALAASGAALSRFVRPRDLDPSLGPDCD